MTTIMTVLVIAVTVALVLNSRFILSLLCAVPFMWLWNWLMPILLNLPEITFLQALGVLLLASVFLKFSHSK
jgi:hypothetical protein